MTLSHRRHTPPATNMGSLEVALGFCFQLLSAIFSFGVFARHQTINLGGRMVTAAESAQGS